MLSIQLDEREIEKRFIEELQKRLKHIENRHTFWDMKTLCKQTCLSENTIKEKFFYDPMFPKHKVGGKWLFPTAECERFLLEWIMEQPTN